MPTGDNAPGRGEGKRDRGITWLRFDTFPPRDLHQPWVDWDLRPFPAFREWSRWCHSHGWGSRLVVRTQDTPPPCPPPSCPPVSGTARPGRLGCRWSHEVAPAPRPHGASPPPGRANPSFPPRRAARHHPTGPCFAGSLCPCSPTPQIPWGSAESRRSGILLAPETQPERSDLRIFTEIWAMPRLPSERTRPATCGGSIRLPARHERTLGFQCRPLFTACFWGRSGEGRSTGVTAQHGWAAAVNTLPGSGPAPPPVNHSCPWKKFMPGQPVPTAALKTPQGGEGEGLETPPHRPSGVTSCGSVPPVVPLMSPPMPLGTTPSPPATPRILSHTCPELAGALPGTLRRAEPAGNVPGKTN